MDMKERTNVGRLAGAEKELGKQKRMLRDLQEKNTLQSETIERQREETKKLQDQVRRQQQVIQDMEAL